MNELNRLRLDYLRAQIACSRLEKAGLSMEINSASTTPERKKEATARYSEVVAALRKAETELEQMRGRM